MDHQEHILIAFLEENQKLKRDIAYIGLTFAVWICMTFWIFVVLCH